MRWSSKPARLLEPDPAPALLDFPDWSGARIEPPRVALEEVYGRSLEAMEQERRVPGFEQRRLATKCRVEFVL